MNYLLQWVGGIRNPYLDVPTAKYTMINEPNSNSTGPSMGRLQTPLLCMLSGWETVTTQEQLRKLYGTPKKYVRKVEKRLNEQETEGCSLPAYRDIIMRDAWTVNFRQY